MQAIWLENRKISFRDDLNLPEVPPGEARVRVRLAGICATDLELVRGYYPFTGVLGHEFVGEVVYAPHRPELTGQRVVGEINAACGECTACRAGRPTHCERRTVLGILDRDGAFAEYLTLPVENLHPVPASIPDEAAVFTEPLAAALEIQEQIHIRTTDRTLLIGAGRLGQLIAQTLALTGCALQVVVRHDYQRELLASRGIATISEDQVEQDRWDVVVDATGSPEGFMQARKAVRPRGTLVLKSTYKGDMRVNFSSLVVDEITLVGSRCGPFPPALRLLANKQVDPTPLINVRFPLSQASAAFEKAAQPGVLKVLLTPQV
ncbi:MAG: alcohol dehydrogenase catalytic domain-containing protein [Anaerolineales bacterium]|jgi:threonine dehydrogenase-like Zn-dependent dehydrogenase